MRSVANIFLMFTSSILLNQCSCLTNGNDTNKPASTDASDNVFQKNGSYFMVFGWVAAGFLFLFSGMFFSHHLAARSDLQTLTTETELVRKAYEQRLQDQLINKQCSSDNLLKEYPDSFKEYLSKQKVEAQKKQENDAMKLLLVTTSPNPKQNSSASLTHSEPDMQGDRDSVNPNRKICTCHRTAKLSHNPDPCMEIEELRNNPPIGNVIPESTQIDWIERVSSLRGLPSHLKEKLLNTVEDTWTWNSSGKCDEVKLYGPNNKVALFHPGWSNGTAAVRGTKSLTGGKGVNYWEIDLSHRVFGSALMFGVGTKQTRLYHDNFIPLLGSDEHSCGISHHGFAYRKGHSIQICEPFHEFCPTKVSMLYDQRRGDLYYFKDDNILNMGAPVFTGLNSLCDSLFPMLSSTASRSEMMLSTARSTFPTLQNICMQRVTECLRTNTFMQPHLPKTLMNQLQTMMKQ